MTLEEEARKRGISISTLRRERKEAQKTRQDELLRVGYILKSGKLVPDQERQDQYLKEIKRHNRKRKRV